MNTIAYRIVGTWIYALILDARRMLVNVSEDALGPYVTIACRPVGPCAQSCAYHRTLATSEAFYALDACPAVASADVPADLRIMAHKLANSGMPAVCPQCGDMTPGYRDEVSRHCPACIMANVLGPAVDRKALQKVGL